jgi:proline-specific peptidase
MTNPVSEHYVTVDGLKTFYVKCGAGYPLVLIHGGSPGACAKVSWKKNLEFLAQSGFEVYAFDQTGFGYTDNPTDYSVEYRVHHASGFIDKLDLRRFHLIGNSQGGYIAARLALQHDARVGGLVLVSSGTLAPKGSEEAVAMAKRHREETQDFVPSLENAQLFSAATVFNEELAKEMAQERYVMSLGKNHETQIALKSAPSPRVLHDDLKNLKAKTLIFWGKNDRGASIERAVLLFNLIPNAELHVFDRCAHWVQWDQADRFNETVASFLQRHG